MEEKESVFIRLMRDAILGVDLVELQHVRVGLNWVDIQVLTDPFVVFRRDRYLPVVLVEELGTEAKYLLFVSAVSLSQCIESIRMRNGTLVGVNLRLRKKGEDRFAAYDVEELTQ